MKKFLLVFLCVSLLSCLICIGVSADSLTTLSNTSWYLNDTINVSQYHNYYLDFENQGIVYNRFLISSGGHSLTFQFVSDSTSVLVYENGSWVDDAYRSITIFGGEDSTFDTALIWFPANATQLPFDTVASGVSLVIPFAGQVLSFITSTSGILSLVGLSIAFAIIPFAVGKVKVLIKGY